MRGIIIRIPRLSHISHIGLLFFALVELNCLFFQKNSAICPGNSGEYAKLFKRWIQFNSNMTSGYSFAFVFFYCCFPMNERYFAVAPESMLIFLFHFRVVDHFSTYKQTYRYHAAKMTKPLVFPIPPTKRSVANGQYKVTHFGRHGHYMANRKKHKNDIEIDIARQTPSLTRAYMQ